MKKSVSNTFKGEGSYFKEGSSPITLTEAGPPGVEAKVKAKAEMKPHLGWVGPVCAGDAAPFCRLLERAAARHPSPL